MGITVISASALAPVSVSPNIAAAGNSGTMEDFSGGFAALLGSQLGLVGNSLQSALSLANTTAPDDGEDAPLRSDSADQTLALLLAVPAVTPPSQPNREVRFDLNLNLNRNEGGQSAIDTTQTQALADKASAASNLPSAAAATTDEQAVDAFKAALSSARDQQGHTPAANIAVESGNTPALQANAALTNAAAANKAHPGESNTDIRTPLHAPNWGQDFSDKVVWMAKNDQQTAQLNINPPQLGPMQITLQINGDQATAIFASPYAEVRQAIESSMSQLRDMLATAGINLGQADVGANMARQNDTAAFQTANGNRASDETAILPGIGKASEGASSAPVQRGRGLVDLFA